MSGQATGGSPSSSVELEFGRSGASSGRCSEKVHEPWWADRFVECCVVRRKLGISYRKTWKGLMIFRGSRIQQQKEEFLKLLHAVQSQFIGSWMFMALRFRKCAGKWSGVPNADQFPNTDFSPNCTTDGTLFHPCLHVSHPSTLSDPASSLLPRLVIRATAPAQGGGLISGLVGEGGWERLQTPLHEGHNCTESTEKIKA